MEQVMQAAIYARVSTVDQHCELQLKELREYIARRGWQIAGEYVDKGWSGAKASRPELDRMLEDAAQHRFDAIVVWKLDRFGRSVLHLSEQLARLDSWGIRFLASSQSIDTDAANPTSRLLLHILSAVAEFERELIRERVKAGLAGYREAYAQGRVGRERHSRSGKDLPIGRPALELDAKRIRRLAKAGQSQRYIAGLLGIGKGTIWRVLGGK